jgi:sulfide:quinone oxidoreductase
VAAHTVQTDATPPLRYDVLVLTLGAHRSPVLPGVLSFDGLRGIVELKRLVDDIAGGAVDAVAFAVPGETAWTLPVYELALLTDAELRRRGITGASLSIVTPESEPLEMFGLAATARVASLLRDRGIALQPESLPRRLGVAHGRAALLTSAGSVPADRVVALPRIDGPAVSGLPTDPAGFIPTDSHGLVHGTANVYAAGDATAYPVKQGGLATQQADAVAVAIAARAGMQIDPRPFDPRLRALLLTGGVPLELGGPGDGVREAPASTWSQKVIGRHLSAWLAERGPNTLEPARH